MDHDTLIGTQAVVYPGLPAGTYTALIIDDTVYVARMHMVCWQMAGRQGTEQFYGFAEIDNTGKVLRLFQ